MRLGGRAQAAIEILGEIEKRKRPASESLKDWGNAHRFAGSGDRAAIGNLVYDALRNKAANCWLIDSAKPRALVMSTLVHTWKMSVQSLSEAFKDDRFAPEMLSEAEAMGMEHRDLNQAPEPVRGNVPEWCVPSLQSNFDDAWIGEAQCLCERPPLDMRVNTLKASREKVKKQLRRWPVEDTDIAITGLRIAPGTRGDRLPNVQSEAAFQKGWFEIQDHGSQIVSDLVFARPGENVLDFCAGAGGKTLALAAAMENKGQIHAYDADKSRLAPIYERVKRAGLRNAQIHAPDADLGGLVGKMDRVVVDAPCTGSGTWRRRPDAKWKLSPDNLEERLGEQEEVLSQAAPFVRPGGYLAYITCSIFPEENENQIYAFIEDNPQFELLSVGEVWQELYGFDKRQPWSADMKTITLTPASTGTDGFFFAVLERKA